MNPDFDRTPAPNTIAPGAFDRMTHGDALNTPQNNPEKAALPEAAPAAQAQNAVPIMPFVPPGTPQQQGAAIAPVANPQPAAMGQPTDEFNDEEVVRKARALIEQTKADPYAQSKEVGKIRIEYINKRFGREIKPDKE